MDCFLDMLDLGYFYAKLLWILADMSDRLFVRFVVVLLKKL